MWEASRVLAGIPPGKWEESQHCGMMLKIARCHCCLNIIITIIVYWNNTAYSLGSASCESHCRTNPMGYLWSSIKSLHPLIIGLLGGWLGAYDFCGFWTTVKVYRVLFSREDIFTSYNLFSIIQPWWLGGRAVVW